MPCWRTPIPIPHPHSAPSGIPRFPPPPHPGPSSPTSTPTTYPTPGFIPWTPPPHRTRAAYRFHLPVDLQDGSDSPIYSYTPRYLFTVTTTAHAAPALPHAAACTAHCRTRAPCAHCRTTTHHHWIPTTTTTPPRTHCTTHTPHTCARAPRTALRTVCSFSHCYCVSATAALPHTTAGVAATSGLPPHCLWFGLPFHHLPPPPRLTRAA